MLLLCLDKSARKRLAIPRRRNVLASAARAATARTRTAAAGRPSAVRSGWNVDRRAGAGERGQVDRRADQVGQHDGADRAGHAPRRARRAWPRPGPARSRARGPSRSAGPGSARVRPTRGPGPGSRPAGPSTAASARVNATMSAAPCGSGELVRAASTAERKVMVAPGMARLTTADSWRVVDRRAAGQDHVGRGLRRPGPGSGQQRHDHERAAARLRRGPGQDARHPDRERPRRGQRGQLGRAGPSSAAAAGEASTGTARAGGQRAGPRPPIGAGREGRERGGRGHRRVAGRVHRDHRDRLAERRDPGRVPYRGGVRDAADRRDRRQFGRP